MKDISTKPPPPLPAVSPTALFTMAALAGLGGCALLSLQLVLGWEYTEGGSTGARWSMIGSMIALALLPVFVAFAWRYGAKKIGAALCVAFCGLLIYSLPATSGRTGEIKEAKAIAAEDVALWRSEYAENAKQLKWALPDKNAECAGAPHPLPPNGWPNCRRKTGTVTALEERQAKLEEMIAAEGKSGVTGDLGSSLWAWALSPLIGATEDAVRKSTVIAFAVGLDFALWALVALAEHLVAMGLVERARRSIETVRPSEPATPAVTRPDALTDESGQSDYPTLTPTQADNVVAFVRPDRDDDPTPPRRSRRYRRDEALADITGRIERGDTYHSQRQLADDYGVPYQTLSDWLTAWEAEGLIVRRKEGRRMAIAAA